MFVRNSLTTDLLNKADISNDKAMEGGKEREKYA
jgi:hypothetical protein